MSLLSNKLKSTGLSQEEIADKLKVSQSYISQVLNGKPLKFTATKKIADAFGWNVYELLLDFDNIESVNKKNITNTAIKVIPIEQNSKPIHEGEDFVWLETYKIPEKAGLSLATNYFAEVYLEELEKGKVRVKKEHFGKYWEVEATGDSMNDGTNRILDKDWFLARDIPRDKWKDKLHIHQWNAFYFLHNERGHIIKEIKSHNTETGEIILHSWNPDKELYGDFTINIRDCYIVANIVKLINRDFNMFY